MVYLFLVLFLPEAGAVALFVIALILTERVCYESARLAWFLIPFTCMIAAECLEKRAGGSFRFTWGTVLMLQGLGIFAFRLIF